MTIATGVTVRPVSDGEDSHGGILKWTKLTGTVVDIWTDCGELRAQVHWHCKCPYPRVVPADWLTIA